MQFYIALQPPAIRKYFLFWLRRPMQLCITGRRSLLQTA